MICRKLRLYIKEENKMPILECSVKTCTHNADNKCQLDSIKIEGRSAESTDGTLCSSFKLRKGDSFSNKCECLPSERSEIVCEAVKCTYNADLKCHAQSIDVCGRNACVSGETECATFKCK